MDGIRVARLHLKHASVVIVILCEDLVALRRHLEGRDVVGHIAAWLAGGQLLDEQDVRLLGANVLDLVRTCRKDRARASRDLRHVRVILGLARLVVVRNLELGSLEEVHGVRRVVVRLVLTSGRDFHLNEPESRELGEDFVALGV